MAPLKAVILGFACATVCAGPNNDFFATAEVLSGADVSFVVDTYGSTIEPGEPPHPPSPMSVVSGPVGETVWYRWTAPASGMLNLEVEGAQWGWSAVSYASGLYRGTSLSNLEAVPRMEAPATATYVWPVTAGETYSLAVGAQYSLAELWPVTNRLTLMEYSANVDFATRPALATNVLRAAFQFGPEGDPAAPALGGELLWWKLPKQAAPGTQRFVLYCSGPGEWLVYEGESKETLRLIDRAESTNSPNSVEIYIPVESNLQYNLAFRPRGATRTGVFVIYPLFTTIRLTTPNSSPIYSGTDLRLNIEGLPEISDTNSSLTIWGPLNLNWGAAWRPPFPTNTVVEKISAGSHKFLLTVNDQERQTIHSAILQVDVIHRNDHFTNALPVTGTEPVLDIDFRGATREPGETIAPDWVNETVWFSWLAPESGMLVFRDWQIEMFTGSSLETLVPAEIAPGTEYWQNVNVVTAGVKYYLRASRRDWNYHYQRQPSFIPLGAAPSNDAFANALPLTGTNLIRSSSVYLATVETNEPINPLSATVWYRWTSPGRGAVTLGGNGIGVVTAYTGTALNSLAPWNWSNGVRAGETLYIRHAGSTLSTNEYRLTLNFLPSPVNDDFSGAIQLTGRSGSVSADFQGVSNEPNEPVEMQPFVPSPAVWYRWTAPESGYLHVEPRAQVRVFTGSSIGTLSGMSSAVTSAKLFQVNAGATYFIRFGSGLSKILRYRLLPNEVTNDLVENATALSGTDIQFSARTYLATHSEGDPTNVLRSVWYTWQAPTNGIVQISTIAESGGIRAYHRMLVLSEDGTEEIASAGAPGTFSFPVSGGSNYILMVGLHTNANTLAIFPPPIRNTTGDVVECSLLFSTYQLTSPLLDQVFTTNDVIMARVSEPAPGIDPPIAKVKFFLPSEYWREHLVVDDSDGILVLTNRLGNGRVSALLEFEDGRTFGIPTVNYRVVDPRVPHDDFAGRELLVGRDIRRPITPAEIRAATTEPGEPMNLSPTLWFKWVAPADGVVSIAPVTSTQSWTFVIRAWQGWQSLALPASVSTSLEEVTYNPLPMEGYLRVFRGSTLAGLQPVTLLTNFDWAFMAQAGQEYAIQLPAGARTTALQLHLTTVAVLQPATDIGTPAGEPLTLELDSTERPEDISRLDILVEGNPVASFSAAPFRTILNNRPPGEYPWRTVLTLRSGEVVTNEHPAIRVYPPNASAENAVNASNDFAFDVRGFRDLGLGRGRTEGPALYYRVRPVADTAVFSREAHLTVLVESSGGASLTPYTFVFGPNSNSTSQERPVYELKAGGTYLLAVSDVFQEDGIVRFEARPQNDAIENAFVIDSLRTNIPLTRVVLAREANEPGSSASVWYRWQSLAEGCILLNQFAFIYAENDTTNNLPYFPDATPTFVYPVQAGVNYYLGFPEPGNVVGQDVLQFRFLPLPAPNDRVATAEEISGSDVTRTFDFFGVTRDPVEVDHGSANASGSLWWRWRSPTTARLSLTIDASNSPVLAHLYIREGETNWTRVPEQITRYARWFNVVAGQEYYIAVERLPYWPGHWPPTQWELVPMTLRLKILLPPANNHFQNAQALTSDTVVRGTTRLATAELGEPPHGGVIAAQSVWYNWRADHDGLVYVKYTSWATNITSYVPRTITVYRGTELHALLPVAAKLTDSTWYWVKFEAQAGQDYMIAVDGRRGTEDFSLLVQTEPVVLEMIRPRITEGGIQFDLPTVLNTPISVQVSTDLVHWHPYTFIPPGHSGPATLPIYESTPQTFYRVVMEGLTPPEE